MKRVALKGKALLSRLTGISTPVGGVSWTPSLDEQDKARRLLDFLEDRRALYRPYHMEVGPFVTDSVIEIRQRLVTDLQDLSTSNVLRESLRAMSAACRKFLDDSQVDHRDHWHLDGATIRSLGELRAVFGIHIARLACAYDLPVEGELATVIPAEPDNEED